MSKLESFIDESGRLIQWPAKHAVKLLAVEYLATKFAPGKTYHESEVNEILKKWHTYQDWALLRRSLVDYGYMIRNRDGTRYQRVERI